MSTEKLLYNIPRAMKIYVQKLPTALSIYKQNEYTVTRNDF